MASTYVNDLRLNEMATGDESGNWGVVTNLNLELIGEALGYGTEGITTNADTHTTTVADGATDPGRAMYIEYTGTLDSACTITIAPNTLNRMHFIENGTSGSQNIIISQGSGANVTIPPGDTKAVYLDGAGSGAAVVDAFASLNVVDLKVQDDLTVTDDATIGGTLGVTGVLTATSLDISGAIDVDGTSNLDVVDIDGAVDMASNLTIAGDIDLAGGIDVDGTSNLDIVDIDGAVDMASTLQVDGAITSSAGATITLADNTDNLTLITTDADGNSGPNLRLYRNSGSPADDDILGQIDFEGRNANSEDIVYGMINTRIMTPVDGSEDSNMYMYIMKSGTQRLALMLDRTEAVFNDDSQDINFRVESNGSTHMLFVDAGNNKVLMSSNPTSDTQSTPHDTLKLAVAYASSGSDGAAGVGPRLVFAIPDDEDNPSVGGGIAVVKESADDSNSVATMTFAVSQNDQTLDEAMRISSNKGLNIGTTSGASAGGIQTYVADNDEAVDCEGPGRVNFTINSDESGGNRWYFRTAGSGNFGSGNGDLLVLREDGTQIMKWDLSAMTIVGDFDDTSDVALKENIIDITDATAKIKALQPRTFDWKDKNKTQGTNGFIAQEVETILPKLVHGNDYDAEKPHHGQKAINTSGILAVAVKAIQELETRVTTLEG